jgi:capsular exopolysaccharide synthesis family protein
MDRISKALERAKQERSATSRGLGGVEQETGQNSFSFAQTVPVTPATLRANRIISGIPNEPLADVYRILRTRVIRRLQQNNWKTLGITSARSREGKTLTAINLGISIAMEPNYSVLLVDADLRRPGVHTFFGIEAEYGLSDYLVSDIAVEQLFINPGIDRFSILPCAHPSKTSSELLATPKMSGLIKELKTKYPARVVIFNLPPALVSDDVVALSPLLDAILLVVRDGKTQSKDLARVAEILEDARLLGSVLNMSLEDYHQDDDYY